MLGETELRAIGWAWLAGWTMRNAAEEEKSDTELHGVHTEFHEEEGK